MKQLKKLSNKHKQMAQWVVLNPTRTLTDLAHAFELSVAAGNIIYHSPLFQDEVNRLLEEQWQDARKIAQKTMIKLAEDGDRQAAQFILQCNGVTPTERQS